MENMQARELEELGVFKMIHIPVMPQFSQLSEPFLPLPPLEPVTLEMLHNLIGLVRNFFLAKLHANDDEPLLEDEELPIGQRPSRPALPENGSITSLRNRG
jgi:transcriptional activator SPT7